MRHKIFRVFTLGILPPDTPGYGEPLPHPRGQLACKSDARVGGTELVVGIIADKNYCNNGVLEYQSWSTFSIMEYLFNQGVIKYQSWSTFSIIEYLFNQGVFKYQSWSTY